MCLGPDGHLVTGCVRKAYRVCCSSGTWTWAASARINYALDGVCTAYKDSYDLHAIAATLVRYRRFPHGSPPTATSSPAARRSPRGSVVDRARRSRKAEDAWVLSGRGDGDKEDRGARQKRRCTRGPCPATGGAAALAGSRSSADCRRPAGAPRRRPFSAAAAAATDAGATSNGSGGPTSTPPSSTTSRRLLNSLRANRKISIFSAGPRPSSGRARGVARGGPDSLQFVGRVARQRRPRVGHDLLLDFRREAAPF